MHVIHSAATGSSGKLKCVGSRKWGWEQARRRHRVWGWCCLMAL